MTGTQLYVEDWIGLKTLNENNRVYLKSIPNANHLEFEEDLIVGYFVPFLYEKNWTTTIAEE